MSFPTYENFKDSGFQWLRKVPDSWEVNVSRRYFYEIREPGKFDDVQLSATQKFGVVPQTMFMELEDQKVVLALKGLSNFKHVEPDDFVISLRSFQGGIERSKYRGCVSPAYTVLRPKKIIDPAFISYVFKSAGYIVALQSVTDGIREGKNIKYDQFAELGLALPPVTEQKIIAKFLDHETAKIDSLVAEQEKLIELLKEKRQAIISNAVTQGIDPEVKMKDSGIEWIGRIPEHWKLNKFSRVFQIKAGGDLKEEFFSDSPDDHHQYPIYTNSKKDNAVYGYTSKFLFEANTITVTGRGDIGYAVYRDHPYDAIIRLLVLTPRNNQPCKYYSYFINSVSNFDLGNTGRTAVSQLSAEQISPHLILEPPIEDQLAINEYLDQENKRISELMESCEKSISLLQERRLALISAAVTGQIDVRNYKPKEAA